MNAHYPPQIDLKPSVTNLQRRDLLMPSVTGRRFSSTGRLKTGVGGETTSEGTESNDEPGVLLGP